MSTGCYDFLNQLKQKKSISYFYSNRKDQMSLKNLRRTYQRFTNVSTCLETFAIFYLKAHSKPFKRPLKMIKDTFYFSLKARFVPKIFKLFS